MMGRNWNERIEDVIAGRWKDPETGKPAQVPFETILIEEDLTGREADLVRGLNLGDSVTVVADHNTWEVMGQRVARALKPYMRVHELVLRPDIGCDEPTIASISEQTTDVGALIAVGSGSLQDAVKFATFKDGRKFCTFGTAASMNGYAATTASSRWRTGSRPPCPPMRRAVSSSISRSAPPRRAGFPPPGLATACAARWRRRTGGSRTACSARIIPGRLMPCRRARKRR